MYIYKQKKRNWISGFSDGERLAKLAVCSWIVA